MSTTVSQAVFPSIDFFAVRNALLAKEEIAFIDVREEDPFAKSHPLWAANFPLGLIELQAKKRIPRLSTQLVIYGHHANQDLAPLAAQRFAALGYTQICLLEGGLAGWEAHGGELFQDVNVPSKSFGELVESIKHTPSLAAEEVNALIAQGDNIVIVDARRFDEYQTMNIPGSLSVPGGELALRIAHVAPDPETLVVVNCAGRTRSIIGTQSLVNVAARQRVAALRNGTIGWLLAGQTLEHGAARQVDYALRSSLVAEQARVLAIKAGVVHIEEAALAGLQDPARNVYLLDVRTPEEYVAGHIAGFTLAPGGQLVQETDHHAPVRGARIILADDDGVRANMAGSWLAQMGWEVYVLNTPVTSLSGLIGGAEPSVSPAALPEAITAISNATLSEWLSEDVPDVQVLDFTTGANYAKGHIPGAWYALRSQLTDVLATIPATSRIVCTCGSGLLASFAAIDVSALTDANIYVLASGTTGWRSAGLPIESDVQHLAVPVTDRYRRPYEGTNNSAKTMQAYLDWEFGLIAQLERDGTHGFNVV
jgi:rhodanese-related sulfurtransferase